MTDSKQIQQLKEQLKDLEIQSRILQVQQEESLDGILVVDSSWKMVSFNQRFVEMWGIPQHIFDSKDDRASVATVLSKLKNPDQFIAQVEYLMRHPTEKSQEVLELKDGRYFDRSSSPVIDKEKNFSGRIWFFRDITQSKRAEAGLQAQNQQLEDLVYLRTCELEKVKERLEEQVVERTQNLKEEQDRLKGITESVPGVVFQFFQRENGESGVSYTNSKLYDIFELEFIDDSQLLLQKFIANIHPSYKESFIQSIAESVKNTAPWEWRGRYVKPSGKVIWFEGKSLPVVRPGEIRFNGFLYDITEKKEQEVRHIETTRQQEQLIKVESLKTMAGAIAHRFNNSMMAVQGNLELMSLSLPKGSVEHRMALDAFQAASGASQVSSMMLSYVGQKSLQLQDVSLGEFVQDRITMLSRDIASHVKISFIASDYPLYCSIDAAQVKEVVESIVLNAIESLPQTGGTVEVSFGQSMLSEEDIPVLFQFDAVRDTGYAYCQIRDNGCGIKAENLGKIFEPFYTTKFVGRGLGMALTVGTMQRHNGAISVASKFGKGTTVRILLPVSSPQQPFTSISGEILSSEAKTFSGTVLIADDEPILLMVCKMMLEQMGFTVHTATDGRSAISQFKNRDVEYRVVLLDIQMPGMDGIEVMAEIRKLSSAVPVLLISGFAQDDAHFKGTSKVKCDGFIEKPVQLAELRRSIEDVLS